MQRYLRGHPVLFVTLLLALFAVTNCAWCEAPFPPTATVDGETLQLNGTGNRRATIFRLKVYVAGLYVRKPSTSREVLLASEGPKQIRMRFLRDIDTGRIEEAWQENFDANNENSREFEGEMGRILRSVRPIEEGEEMTITFSPEKVIIQDKAQILEIKGRDFSQALLRIWLGENPSDSSLQKRLLGEN